MLGIRRDAIICENACGLVCLFPKLGSQSRSPNMVGKSKNLLMYNVTYRSMQLYQSLVFVSCICITDNANKLEFTFEEWTS